MAGPSLAVSRPLGSGRRVSLALYIYTRTVLYIYIYVMSVYILFFVLFFKSGFPTRVHATAPMAGQL